MEIDDIVQEQEIAGNVTTERKITINAIMSTEYMKGVKPLLSDLTLIESKMCRTILSWCNDYWQNYGVAMKETVQDIFDSNKNKLSPVVAQDISDFLKSISEQYAKEYHIYNVKLDINLAEDYLDKQGIIKLKQNIETAMQSNNTVKAKQYVSNYSQIKQAPGMAVDGMKDFSRYSREISQEDVLFNMPKPFDELHGPIRRKHLSAVAGKAKSGKSFMMAKVAAEALRNGLSVFIASLEMDEDSFLQRIDQEILRADQFGGNGYIPYFKGEGSATQVCHEHIYRDPATVNELENGWKSFKMKHPHARLFVKEWGQGMCSVDDDLIPQLDYIRESEGVNIDVCVVDYGDLLKPCKGDERADQRIKVGNIWKALKRVAQSKNLFMFTGSQLNRENILAESATKEQDANSIIRIEQTPIEKKLGLYREYVMFHRNIEYDPSRAMICTSNIGVGLFNLDGRWLTEDFDHIPDIDTDNMYLWKRNTGQEWREEQENEYK